MTRTSKGGWPSGRRRGALARACGCDGATGRRGDGTEIVADVASTMYTTADGRVRTVVTFRDLTEEIEDRSVLVERLRLLEDRADRDPLTGLLNRRAFTEACEHVFVEADRRGVACHLAFVDIDALKATNDADGHSAGDALLTVLAAALQRVADPDDDVVARIGGDEFVIVATGTTSSEVGTLMERARRALAADPSAPPGVSFSVGVTERLPGDPRGLDVLIDAADHEMYRQRTLRRLRRGRRRHS